MSDEESFDLPEDEEAAAEPSDAPDDVATARGLRRRRKRIAFTKKNVVDFWRRALADPVGRYVIWQMLADSHCFEERFACGPNGFPQTEATWFHAGEQAFGQRLFRTLSVYAREGVMAMQDEHDPAFAEMKKIMGDVNG